MTPSYERTLKVALEHHFLEVDGKIYTDIMFDYEFWHEFLDVFDRVEPVARVSRKQEVPDGWIRADGPQVRFHKVYDYLGFWQFIRHVPCVYHDCGRAVREPTPVLLRMGNLSLMCWLHLRWKGRPYAFEGLGHAGMSAARVENVQRFGLGKLIGFVYHWFCRRLALEARCGNYVSKYLQRIYPTRSGRHEWVVSDVRLPPEAFSVPRLADCFACSPLRIICVGRLEPEKGHAVLLKAVASLTGRGRDVHCDIVGPGQELGRLRKLAQDLGICDRAVFHGPVAPGPPITALLRQADLFVLPSFTEGLGRALVEAMAVGLPAIGSDTGGIPELLEREALVPPGDPDALADAIERMGWDRATLARLSRSNFEVAQRYRLDVLGRLRHEFWTCILSQYREHQRRSRR